MRNFLKVAKFGYHGYGTAMITFFNKSYYKSGMKYVDVKVEKDCSNYPLTGIPCCGWYSNEIKNKKIIKILDRLYEYANAKHRTTR